MHIAPLRPSFLHRARTEGLDDRNQPVKRVVAAGGEPCRDVLRRAEPGEALLLASHSPFALERPYREFGPVFILAQESGEPAGDAFTNGYFRSQFVIRAYTADESIADAAMVTPATADETAQRFFARDDVAFLHARFPLYGCFALRLDRRW
jgi:hypothetical protein